MKRLNVIGTGTPHDLEFSPDGKLFGVATGRGVYLFDAKTFQEVSFIDVNDSVDALAFSPEGDVLAVAVNGKASLWNIASGRKLSDLDGGLIYMYELAYGRGGYVAALGGNCRGCGEPYPAIILWNARDGSQIYFEDNFGLSTTALVFSADGKQLFFGGGGIRVLETRTGKQVADYRTGARRLSAALDAPYDFILDPSGTQFFVTSYEKPNEVFDATTGARTPFSLCDMYVVGAANGLTGACAKDQKIVTFDSRNGEALQSIDIDVNAGALGDLLALSPDGSLLAYYGKYGVYVVDAATGKKLKSLGFTDFRVAQAWIIEVDGSRRPAAAVIGSSGKVAVYDLQTGGVLRTIQVNCCVILSFAFAPDLKTAATVDDGHHLTVWDLQSSKVVYQVVLQDYEDDPIAFSPDGTSLFFIKESAGTVLEYIFATGKTLVHATDNFGYLRVRSYINENVHFNGLGDLVMLGFQNDHPFFVDMKTGSRIVIPFEARADADFLVTYAFSHDGHFLSTGVHDGILVWNLETLKITSSLLGHEMRSGDGWSGTIISLISNPQSNLLVSTGEDQTTRLWNITSGTELRRLNVCCSTSFTPDGRYLVTAGDGAIRVWGIP